MPSLEGLRNQNTLAMAGAVEIHALAKHACDPLVSIVLVCSDRGLSVAVEAESTLDREDLMAMAKEIEEVAVRHMNGLRGVLAVRDSGAEG